MDTSRFQFRVRGRVRDLAPDWTVERAPASAALAVNLGMYTGIVPWGWTVMGGQEVRPPGDGPLSNAIAWDAAGRLHWLAAHEIAPARAAGDIVEAFQAYPALLDEDGEVPEPLRTRGQGVDVDHRDGRLAIGVLDDGRLLIAMTRFYALGESSPAFPIGLTLAEMATLMRRLGCRRAVALDGGISAQLMLREGRHARVWRGWRAVPFGLVAELTSVVAAPTKTAPAPLAPRAGSSGSSTEGSPRQGIDPASGDRAVSGVRSSSSRRTLAASLASPPTGSSP
jgi:hypothetical protein